ncbi:dihydroxyacid dehydratase/phosphogluconate dehydratase [Bradyrhizobium sp. i1.4.4]
MDAKTDIKQRLPSRHVTEGPTRAPHRSYFYAMGLTTDQIHQPFVGVASCWNGGRPLQHLPDAPGPGGEKGRGIRRRHPP